MQVLLDGRPLALKNDRCAIFLQALLDAKGHWVSEENIKTNCPKFETARVGRVRKQLPKEIQPFVEAEPGKGNRIVGCRLA